MEINVIGIINWDTFSVAPSKINENLKKRTVLPQTNTLAYSSEHQRQR
jgi:hypothetical protein